MVDEERVPEFYTDAVRLTTTPYGVAFTFGLKPPHPTPAGDEGSLPRFSGLFT